MNIHTYSRIVLLFFLVFIYQHHTSQGLSLEYAIDNFFETNRIGRKWAVLVAGSNGYYNYRHQADIAHAYHLLKNKGVQTKHIIVMMYNDVANSSLNPFPGRLFNDYSHKDYYSGLKIDYEKEDVTPENFMEILKGGKLLKNRGYKVLESNSKDNVFIYYTDHGAPGEIEFIDNSLYADELNYTLTYMHKHRRYNKLLLYVEACESGSMFEGILSNKINVLAISASKPDESSYACFYDDSLETYLTDCFSYNWMNDSDNHMHEKRNLRTQFKYVKEATNTSTVMAYGDISMLSYSIDDFQGSNPREQAIQALYYSNEKMVLNSVPAYDVTKHILLHQLSKAKSPQDRLTISRRLSELRKQELLVSSMFRKVVEIALNKAGLNMSVETIEKERHPVYKYIDCYKKSSKSFKSRCTKNQQSSEFLMHFYKLVNLCAHGIAPEFVNEAIETVCT